MSLILTAAAVIALAAFMVFPVAAGSTEDSSVLDGADSEPRDWDITRETAPGVAENRNRP